MQFLTDFGIDVGAALRAIELVQQKLDNIGNKPVALTVDTKLASQNVGVLAAQFQAAQQALQTNINTNKTALAQLALAGQTGSEQYKKLVEEIKDAQSELKKMGDAAKQVEKDGTPAFERLSSGLGKMQNFFSTGGGLLVGGIGALATGVFALGKKMIDANQETETYATQLTSLMGNATLAKERIAQLSKFGAETPFDLPGLVKAEKVLIGFGLQGEKALKLTGQSATQLRTTIGDVAAAFAGTGPTFDEIALIFGKFSSGAVGEAITRLQELGIVTKEELKEVGVQFDKAGGLLSPLPVAMQAAVKIAQEKFGGGMKNLSETAAGQLSTFADAIEQGFVQVGAPLFQVFKDLIGQINKFMESDTFKGILNTFTTLIGGAIKGAIELAKFIGDLITKAFMPLIEVFKPLFTNANGLGGSFSKLGELVQPVGRLLLEGLKLPLELVATAISSALQFIISFGTALANFIKGVADFGRAIGEAVGNGIQKVVQAINDAFSAINRFFSALFGVRNEAQQTGSAMGNISVGVEKARSAFDTLKGTIGGLVGAFKTIKVVLGEAFQALSSFNFQKVGEILTSAGGRISDSFTKDFNGSVNEIKSSGEAAGKDLAAAARKLNDEIIKLSSEADSITVEALAARKDALRAQVKATKEAGDINEKEANAFAGRITSIKKTFKDLAEEIKNLQVKAPDLTKGQVSEQKTALLAEAKIQLQAQQVTQAEYKKYVEEINAIGKKEKDGKDKIKDAQAKFNEDMAKLLAEEQKLRNDIGEKAIDDDVKRAVLNIENKKKEEETKLAIELSALAKRKGAKEIDGQQEAALTEQQKKNSALRIQLLDAETDALLKRSAEKQVSDTAKIAQDRARQEIEAAKRAADAITAQDENSVTQRNDFRMKAMQKQADIELEEQLRNNDEYKKALLELGTLDIKQRLGITVDQATLDTAKQKLVDLRNTLTTTDAGLTNLVKQQSDAQKTFALKADFEIQEARIKAISNGVEREYKLKVLALERTKAEEIKAAGDNTDLKLNADRRYYDERLKLDLDYRRKTDILFSATEDLSKALVGLQIAKPDAKAIAENRKQLKDEEAALRQSLRKREITFAEYRDKIAEIQRQRNELDKKEKPVVDVAGLKFTFDQIQQLANVFNTSVSKSLDTFAAQQTEKFTQLAGQGKVAFDALGLAAGATFASMVLNGENAGKAVLLTLIDVVSKGVLAFTPQIIAASIAFLGPVAGPIAAGVAIAGLQAALALSRSAVKAADGVVNLQGPGTEKSDSIPAWLSRGESVLTAETTRREFELISHIHSGGTSTEYFVDKHGKLIHRLVQDAISKEMSSVMTVVNAQLMQNARVVVLNEFTRNAVRRESNALGMKNVVSELQKIRAENVLLRKEMSNGLAAVESAAGTETSRKIGVEVSGGFKVRGSDFHAEIEQQRYAKLR